MMSVVCRTSCLNAKAIQGQATRSALLRSVLPGKPALRSLVRTIATGSNGANGTAVMENAQCETTPADAISFLMLVHNLKTNKRTGWIRRKVDNPESIADHMYRMSVMGLLFAGSNVDFGRLVMMAVVHDMAEAIVGDITPHCGVSPEEKKQREAAAVQEIKDLIGANTKAAQLVESLWREYEGAATPSAQLVKDFDKIEMILQAYEYEIAQGKRLDEFFQSTAGKFKTPVGRQWAAEVVRRRTELWQDREQGNTQTNTATSSKGSS